MRAWAVLAALASALFCLPAVADGPFLVDPSRSEVLAVTLGPDRTQLAIGGIAGVARFQAIDRAGIEPDADTVELVGIIGGELRRAVTLLSAGDRALRIDTLAIEDLSIDGIDAGVLGIEDLDCLPAPLPSSMFCRFELVFAPQDLVELNGKVVIESNATIEPIELALSASARTAELFQDRFEGD